jgi:electron transport complex protein RnfB
MNAVWIAVIAISLLGLIFGLILGYASRRLRWRTTRWWKKLMSCSAEPVWAVRLPGCRPYAEAVGTQGEKINRCAPAAKR